MIKRIVLFLFLLAGTAGSALAQCAMCRTTIVNNVSAGETTLAASLNTGIMYLFFTPYILVGLIILLWFRYSKKHERKISIISRIRK